MSKLQRARLAGVASMAAAMALVSTSLPTLAANNDALVVTGGSVEIIELAIVDDDTAQFGNMSPDGTATTEATAFTDAAGACYKWVSGANNVSVRSNVAYEVRAAVSVDANNLLFNDVAEPASFAACESGAPVSGPGIENTYLKAGSPTAGTFYNTWLTVRDVNWTEPAVNINTTITFTATAS